MYTVHLGKFLEYINFNKNIQRSVHKHVEKEKKQ